MLANDTIRRKIRDEKVFDITLTIKVSRPEGMQTMDQALADSVKSNIVTLEVARMKSSNPVKLQESLQSGRKATAF